MGFGGEAKGDDTCEGTGNIWEAVGVHVCWSTTSYVISLGRFVCGVRVGHGDSPDGRWVM